MSYANMDGVPSQTGGTSELLAADWNTYVRDNFDSIKFGHVTVADDSAKSALSVAEGTMVYQLDNQKVFVYSGSSWVEVSDLDSTDGVSATAQTKLDNVGLVHIATVTATSGTTVIVNDCFSSTYENYLIVGYGETVTNYNNVSLRLRVSGADNSSNYNYGVSGGRTNGNSFLTGAATAAQWFLLHASTADRHGFTATIAKPNLVKRSQYHGYGNGQDITSEYGAAFGGSHNDTTQYTGFSLITGTIVDFKVRVYGFRNS